MNAPRRKTLRCPQCEGRLSRSDQSRRYTPEGRRALAAGTAVGMLGFAFAFFAIQPLVFEALGTSVLPGPLVALPCLPFCLPGVWIARRAGGPQVVGTCRHCEWSGPWEEVLIE